MDEIDRLTLRRFDAQQCQCPSDGILQIVAAQPKDVAISEKGIKTCLFFAQCLLELGELFVYGGDARGNSIGSRDQDGCGPSRCLLPRARFTPAVEVGLKLGEESIEDVTHDFSASLRHRWQ